jgi:hypothetical protein
MHLLNCVLAVLEIEMRLTLTLERIVSTSGVKTSFLGRLNGTGYHTKIARLVSNKDKELAIFNVLTDEVNRKFTYCLGGARDLTDFYFCKF